MHGRPCYEVEFSDGEVILADGEHQWLTWTRAARRYEAQTRGLQRSPGSLSRRGTDCGTRSRVADPLLSQLRPAPSRGGSPGISPRTAWGIRSGDGHADSAPLHDDDRAVSSCSVEASGWSRGRPPVVSTALRSPPKSTASPSAAASFAVRRSLPKSEQAHGAGAAEARPGSCLHPWHPRCRRWRGAKDGPVADSGLCHHCWKAHGSVQAELRTLGVLGHSICASISQRRELLVSSIPTGR